MQDPATQAGAEAPQQDVPASFFSWFSVEMALETEYDAIAAAFVDQLWPDPVRWYLGDGVSCKHACEQLSAAARSPAEARLHDSDANLHLLLLVAASVDWLPSCLTLILAPLSF